MVFLLREKGDSLICAVFLLRNQIAQFRLSLFFEEPLTIFQCAPLPSTPMHENRVHRGISVAARTPIRLRSGQALRQSGFDKARTGGNVPSVLRIFPGIFRT
jgi:hypothetical protein